MTAEGRAPVEHDLKTWPSAFQPVLDGRKTLDLRPDDRDFQAGDTLLLREWDPGVMAYTGRSCRRRVTHVLGGRQWGLEEGHVALSLREVDADDGWLAQARRALEVLSPGLCMTGVCDGPDRADTASATTCRVCRAIHDLGLVVAAAEGREAEGGPQWSTT